jgi:tRNA(adenine34) deaminase
MVFSKNDKKFMNLALSEAKKALDNNDYPVGAVLVIGGVLIEKARNSLYSGKDWVSHAESNLIRKCSPLIKDKVKSNNSKVELFTTLEPCLMCLGSSILHRISRIVFACPDLHGGATGLDKKSLSDWYNRKWPEIEGGLLKEESYELMVKFMRKQNTESWNKILKTYKQMREDW